MDGRRAGRHHDAISLIFLLLRLAKQRTKWNQLMNSILQTEEKVADGESKNDEWSVSKEEWKTQEPHSFYQISKKQDLPTYYYNWRLTLSLSQPRDQFFWVQSTFSWLFWTAARLLSEATMWTELSQIQKNLKKMTCKHLQRAKIWLAIFFSFLWPRCASKCLHLYWQHLPRKQK